ncbi:hypothetical protein QWI18_14185 [Pseudomonas sp. W2Oct36]|jgi:hypothetical protein|nr:MULTISPECIES: hypothetical protein [unclassified Pseudomonas]
MQLSSIFRSLLAAYACGASGSYDRASQDYGVYQRAFSAGYDL